MTATSALPVRRRGAPLLLLHCRVLDPRAHASTRLEQELGEHLARRLVRELADTQRERRGSSSP